MGAAMIRLIGERAQQAADGSFLVTIEPVEAGKALNAWFSCFQENKAISL